MDLKRPIEAGTLGLRRTGSIQEACPLHRAIVVQLAELPLLFSLQFLLEALATFEDGLQGCSCALVVTLVYIFIELGVQLEGLVGDVPLRDVLYLEAGLSLDFLG